MAAIGIPGVCIGIAEQLVGLLLLLLWLSIPELDLRAWLFLMQYLNEAAAPSLTGPTTFSSPLADKGHRSLDEDNVPTLINEM